MHPGGALDHTHQHARGYAVPRDVGDVGGVPLGVSAKKTVANCADASARERHIFQAKAIVGHSTTQDAFNFSD